MIPPATFREEECHFSVRGGKADIAGISSELQGGLGISALTGLQPQENILWTGRFEWALLVGKTARIDPEHGLSRGLVSLWRISVVSKRGKASE